MKRIISLGIAAMLMIIFFACDSDPKNAKIEVWLTDAPGDYKSVNVEITGVAVHATGGDQPSGWKFLDTRAGVYDLLKLTNGLDTLLGTLEVPAGKISQLRLVLGNNNSIRIDDKVFVLSTPSGQQSGLKLLVNQTLAEGITYKILLDFDVARSVLEHSNGKYSLKPVIRTITEAQNGAIKGIVAPAESTPAVYAIHGVDTLGTTYADAAGKFLIRGLPEGTYTVAISPNSNYYEVSETGVTVSLGNVTDIGEIQLAK